MSKSKRKGGPKRTPLQRKVDIALITRLLRWCQDHDEVTEQVNRNAKGKYTLSRQQVSADIAEAINQIVERHSLATVQARMIAADRQLELAALARAEYDRSVKLDRIKRITESATGKNEDGKIKTGKTRTETESRLGDPRYITEARQCITEYCRLLGLYVQPIKPIGDEAPIPANVANQFNINVTISDGKKRAADPLDQVKQIHAIEDDRHKPAAGEAEKAIPANHGGIVIRTSSAAT
jgi:hypothetical protein